MPFGMGKEEEQSRKLFIGGMSHETTDEGLEKYFGKYGNVCDSVVIKEKGSERSKGFGFVTYQTEEEADACMNDRPHFLDERQIDVKRAVSREESSKPGAHVQVKKIFIGGIRDSIGEDTLKDYFSEYGSVVNCEIPYDANLQKSKSFGFVTFDDFDPVDKLVAKRHHHINGVRCEVKKALSKQEMEKARVQLEIKQREKPYHSMSRGSSSRRSGGYTMSRRGNDRGDYNHRGYEDEIGMGGYSDDYGYGKGYSNYGPMRSQGAPQRAYGGPYGGGYGSGAGYGGYGSSYDYDDGSMYGYNHRGY